MHGMIDDKGMKENREDFIFHTDPLKDKVALITPQNDQTATYGQLQSWVRRLQQASALSIPEGSSVAIIISNGMEFVVSFLAIIGSKMVAAPHDPTATEEELEFFLQDINAALIISSGATDIKVSQVAARLAITVLQVDLDENRELCITEFSSTDQKFIPLKVPQGTCLFLHTSGTTSKPKLVPITYNSLVHSARCLSSAYELTKSDTLLLAMPLFHVHGLIGNLLTGLLSGGTVVIPPKFSASMFMKWACQYNVTWFSAVPTIYQILLSTKENYLNNEHLSKIRGHLRFIRSCSAGISPTLLASLQKTFKVPIVQAYGMTESAHLTTTGVPTDPNIPIGSAGRPIGRIVKIQEGEICICGEGVMSGYVKPETANATAFTEDGYFRTGDLGHLDEEGYLFVHGRIKELINRGGEKINPHQVEEIVLGYPGVKEAIVFSLLDQIYGETVGCVLVPCDVEVTSSVDQASGLEKELEKHCQAHLSAFKCPTKYFIVSEIPKSSIGKVQRAHLTRLYSSS